MFEAYFVRMIFIQNKKTCVLTVSTCKVHDPVLNCQFFPIFLENLSLLKNKTNFSPVLLSWDTGVCLFPSSSCTHNWIFIVKIYPHRRFKEFVNEDGQYDFKAHWVPNIIVTDWQHLCIMNKSFLGLNKVQLWLWDEDLRISHCSAVAECWDKKQTKKSFENHVYVYMCAIYARMVVCYHTKFLFCKKMWAP